MNLWEDIKRGFMGMVLKALEAIDPTEEEDEGLYPPFTETVVQLILEARVQGLDVGLFEGLRSWEEQAELYAKGRTKPGKIVTNAKPGYSWHNFGIAADIVFKDKGKWSWSLKHDWKKLGKIGKDLGLEWGGEWANLVDLPHFQLKTNMTLTRARELYRKAGISEVWKRL